ncbi:MAG: trypsin-like peptidase domain-containing protein [Candidatus Acidiferrales bacterium]
MLGLQRLKGRALWVLFLAAVLCVLSANPLRAQSKPQDARQDILNQFSDSMDELTARVSPAVVQVRVTGYRAVEDKDESDASLIGRQRSLASGVIVDPDGYIITNAHVVKGAQRVRVFLTPASAADGQVRSSLGVGEHLPPLDAKVIGIAPTFDLALLKVEAKGLPTLRFADYKNLKKGQIVLAFGNPEGLENSVTMGIVSAVARQADPNSPTVYIQTDAPINPGNSGGPLVDTQGQVVGINTFILSETGGSQGLGFAIPSSLVEFVYGELRRHGRVHRSIIGANLQEITPDLASGLSLSRRDGVIVSDILPDGPAAKAGLKIQDVILSVDDRPIGALPIAEMTISTKPTGATVRMEVLRGDDKFSLEIPVAEQKEKIDRIADLVDPAKSLVAKLGIFGVQIDDRFGDEVQDLRIPSGIVVAALSADLSGVETELQAGDVIHAVNGKRVETLDGLRAAVNAIAPGGAGVLQIERDEKLTYITFEVD